MGLVRSLEPCRRRWPMVTSTAPCRPESSTEPRTTGASYGFPYTMKLRSTTLLTSTPVPEMIVASKITMTSFQGRSGDHQAGRSRRARRSRSTHGPVREEERSEGSRNRIADQQDQRPGRVRRCDGSLYQSMLSDAQRMGRENQASAKDSDFQWWLPTHPFVSWVPCG